MNERKAISIQKAVRWLKNQFTSDGLILLYHRVIELPTDPYLLAITPEHFADHLAILRRHYHPLTLSQMISAKEAGRLPRGAVALTLDDGYADNLHFVKPLLEKYDVPATVFVVTGNVASGEEFWWDELEQLFLQPGALPESLCLQISGRTYEWSLGNAASYEKANWQLQRDWNYGRKDDPTPRHHVFRALWQVLHDLPEGERDATLGQIREWAGTHLPPRSSHRALTAAELTQLASSDLVEIGAHTVTHPRLGHLHPPAQQRQIYGSKKALETMLGRPVKGFSYPHGLKNDYTAETVALTRGAGFAYACAAFAGKVAREVDNFQLPRNAIADCDGDALFRRLRELAEV